MRVEAAKSLEGAPGEVAKNALLAAVKDPDPHVRARAIESLGALKDPSLAATFQQSLNDQSYAVIRAAAEALGETKNPAGYDSLMKLLDMPSWRENIRVAGLNGLATLGDKRSMDVALKYVAPGNPAAVRGAAMTLLAAVGKGDPRAYAIISEAFLKSASPYNFFVFAATGRALVELGDQQAMELFKKVEPMLQSPRAKGLLQQLEMDLKKKATP